MIEFQLGHRRIRSRSTCLSSKRSREVSKRRRVSERGGFELLEERYLLATTVQFQDGLLGYSGTRDTTITSEIVDQNFGTIESLEFDGSPDRASLIKWNTAYIPATSTVSAASITINVTNKSSDTFFVYEVKQDWSESEATWTEYSNGNSWEISGVLGSSDRGLNVLGEVKASSVGLATIDLNVAGRMVVQSWIDNPTANRGLVIQQYIDASNGVDFLSRETPVIADRPLLTVTFTPGTGTNKVPLVDGGPDQTIRDSEAVRLTGMVMDDGLPLSPGQVVTTWSAVDGPGDVTFTDASAPDTIAGFSAPGNYLLRLTVDDGEYVESDDVAITVLESLDQLDGIWLSDSELMALPTSGTAWQTMMLAAEKVLPTPKLRDKRDFTDVNTLAKAMVGQRLDQDYFRDQARTTIRQIMGTEVGGTTLGLGRNLASYVIAADIIGLEPADDAQFRVWLRDVLSQDLDEKTLQNTHEDRPNNWGTMAGASRAAVAAYLGDEVELARTAQVFKGWLGDRSSYIGFRYGSDLSWQANPLSPVGINPMGATKNGISIDGALPEEMRRGDSFTWPPAETGYPWEGLQGAVVQAEILYRAGYDTWQWEDQALLRAAQFLFDIGWKPTGDDEWVPWLIDARYGTNFADDLDASPGKVMGWTAWTHQGPNARPVVDTQSVTIVEDTAVALTLTGTDRDGHTLAFEVVNGPSAGTLSGQGANLVYTPNANYHGLDSFTFIATDGREDSLEAVVFITVTSIPDNPVAHDQTITTELNTAQAIRLIGTDGDGDALSYTIVSSPSHGSLRGIAPNLTYVPNFGYQGADSFTFQVNDGNVDSVVGTVSIGVGPLLVTFQDGVNGYFGTRDTSILRNSPNVNFGLDSEVKVDGRPDKATLLRWDLTGVAPGTTIQSVSMTFNVTNKSDYAFEIYGLRQVWVENEATWNEFSVGNEWEIEGASGNNDRGSGVIGTALLSSTGMATIQLNTAGVALVQSWVDNPTANFGLVIQNYTTAAKNGLRFSSREALEINHRPKLTVGYVDNQTPRIESTRGNTIPLEGGEIALQGSNSLHDLRNDSDRSISREITAKRFDRGPVIDVLPTLFEDTTRHLDLAGTRLSRSQWLAILAIVERIRVTDPLVVDRAWADFDTAESWLP